MIPVGTLCIFVNVSPSYDGKQCTVVGHGYSEVSLKRLCGPNPHRVEIPEHYPSRAKDGLWCVPESKLLPIPPLEEDDDNEEVIEDSPTDNIEVLEV